MTGTNPGVDIRGHVHPPLRNVDIDGTTSEYITAGQRLIDEIGLTHTREVLLGGGGHVHECPPLKPNWRVVR